MADGTVHRLQPADVPSGGLQYAYATLNLQTVMDLQSRLCTVGRTQGTQTLGKIQIQAFKSLKLEVFTNFESFLGFRAGLEALSDSACCACCVWLAVCHQRTLRASVSLHSLGMVVMCLAGRQVRLTRVLLSPSLESQLLALPDARTARGRNHGICESDVVACHTHYSEPCLEMSAI